MLLANEVALVTGASRGLGRAIFIELGRQGAMVVGTATSADGAEKINQSLRENDIKGLARVLDVTDGSAIEALLGELEKTVGAVGILVNNAGITRDGLLMRMSEADWDAVLDTDLKSVYRMTKACLRPMMKARKGRVINITSVVGELRNPGQANYAAAKAGGIGFTPALAPEIGRR